MSDDEVFSILKILNKKANFYLENKHEDFFSKYPTKGLNYFIIYVRIYDEMFLETGREASSFLENSNIKNFNEENEISKQFL